VYTASIAWLVALFMVPPLGQSASQAGVCAATQTAKGCGRMITGCMPRAVGLVERSVSRSTLWRVAVYCDRQLSPAGARRAASRLAGLLKRHGYTVQQLGADEVTDSRMLRADRFRVLVLLDATKFPAVAARTLERYLRDGGHLLVIGGPPFVEPAWRRDGRWWTAQSIRQAIQAARPVHTLWPFDRMEDLAGWKRSTNDPSKPGWLKLVDLGPRHGKGLYYCTTDLSGWDTWSCPPARQLFPVEDKLLCFQARGDERTPQLLVEVRERDGSRWMAVVELSTEWQWVVLSERDFRYWSDSPTGRRRGGPADRLHFDRATVVNFGLAHSHTTRVGDGPHQFWIDDVGSAPNPFGDWQRPPVRFPILETLYPRYKTYPIKRATQLRLAGPATGTRPVGEPTEARRHLLPRPAFSCIARPRGLGFFDQRKWRWIPLVEATDAAGNRRGTVLWMLLHRQGPYRRSILLGCGVGAEAAITDTWLSQQLMAALDRLQRGLFLLQAGANGFTLYEDQPVRLQAEAVNFGTTAAEVRVTFSLVPRGSSSGKGYQVVAVATVPPGQQKRIDAAAPFPLRLSPGKYLVTVELIHGDTSVDRIAHELCVLQVRKPAADEFVRVDGDRFVRKGRTWTPVGVNYWPLYVSGLEPSDYTAGWLKPAYYDPIEIERDLALMNELGINMVSIQLGGPESAANLIDFLRRCGEHGILVNGFLGGASPIRFNEDAVQAELEAARLVDNPVLFAYDIIWEPGNWMFRADWRPRWNRDWTEWVRERYGSIEAAETDWGFRARRDANGLLAGPTTRQMREDGPWRVMVAAYRRFMDDLMSAKWNAAVRRLRQIDPNHLISFRQGNTLPQDFTFTATPKHIDFICPEGYAIPHSELGYNAACFVTRFVTFTTRGKPVVWAEFGRSVWDRTRMEPNRDAYADQAEYHELFYRACVDSGAAGTAPWWWPGGYRTNERSDYGIIDPDGTPRPAALLIKKYAAKLQLGRQSRQPIEWFTIDRDAHPGGYWYVVFHEGAEAWARARQAGKRLHVRSPGTGTTSVDTPLVAVGNRPYNGHNPPKYLDAEFNHLQVLDVSGTWREARDGTAIRVRPDRPVRIRVSVGNIQEATWIAPKPNGGDQTGTVWLATTNQSDLKVRIPIPRDTPYLADAELGEQILVERLEKKVLVELQMTALNRMWFGEKRTFVLEPASETHQ